jgi:hypothetical protein
VRIKLLNVLIIGMAINLSAADLDERWSILKRITKKRSYAVMRTDSQCFVGDLVSVSDDAITLQVDPTHQKVIDRVQILRVADHEYASSHDIVFSARSSWSDVMAAAPTGSEHLLIVTKQGERFRWRKPSVSGSSITRKSKTIEKADIQSVAYVRFTPITASEQYFSKEDASFFAPRLWFNWELLPKIPISLYSSADNEDNSPLKCKSVWRPQRDSNPR